MSAPDSARRAHRRWNQAWAGLSPNLQGAIWMTCAACGFTVNGVMVKWLGAGGMDAFQIAFARAVFALAAVLPFAWQIGPAVLRTRHLGIHLLRGLAGGGAMICGFYALTKLPLADVTALGFTTPLFTIVLAVLILKEEVRWRRWTATAVGFLGVLIMLRPGATALDPAALIALMMAFGIALAVTLVKRLPPGESRVTMLLFFCVISILMAFFPAMAVWRDPTWIEWLLLAGVGVLGVISQSMIIRAYQCGDASFVAPFDYSKLLLAGLLGFLLFSETPDLWSLAGALVIVGATLYIARREAAQGRAPVASNE